MDKNRIEFSRERQVMARIQESEELYAVMSVLTNMPYVFCDPETFDDEIFVYFSQEDAARGARWISEQKNPIRLAKIAKKDSLDFFTSLFPMGVNAIVVDKELDSEITIQLNTLIERKDGAKKQERIENPELHLTTLYMAQEIRKNAGMTELPEALRQLDEEMGVHFTKGRYYIVMEEKGGIPLLQKDGKSYQAIFSDIREVQKFDKDKRFRLGVLEFEDIKDYKLPQADGIVMNPYGVNLILTMNR